MKKNSFYLLFMSLVIACQSGPNQAEMTESIKSLQQEIGATSQPPPDKVEAFQKALVDYADAFPADSNSVQYLSKAGETARLLRQFDRAFEWLTKPF
jgi:hypothetical protein